MKERSMGESLFLDMADRIALLARQRYPIRKLFLFAAEHKPDIRKMIVVLEGTGQAALAARTEREFGELCSMAEAFDGMYVDWSGVLPRGASLLLERDPDDAERLSRMSFTEEEMQEVGEMAEKRVIACAEKFARTLRAMDGVASVRSEDADDWLWRFECILDGLPKIGLAEKLRVSCHVWLDASLDTGRLGWIYDTRRLNKFPAGIALGCWQTVLPMLHSSTGPGLEICGANVLLTGVGDWSFTSPECDEETVSGGKCEWRTWYYLEGDPANANVEELRAEFGAIQETEKAIWVLLQNAPPPLRLYEPWEIGWGGVLVFLAAKGLYELLRYDGSFRDVPESDSRYVCDLLPDYLSATEYAFEGVRRAADSASPGEGPSVPVAPQAQPETLANKGYLWPTVSPPENDVKVGTPAEARARLRWLCRDMLMRLRTGPDEFLFQPKHLGEAGRLAVAVGFDCPPIQATTWSRGYWAIEPDVGHQWPAPAEWEGFISGATPAQYARGYRAHDPAGGYPSDVMLKVLCGECGATRLTDRAPSDAATHASSVLIHTLELWLSALEAPDAAKKTSRPQAKRKNEQGSDKGPPQKTRVEWLAKAMLLVKAHPDWSDAEIARQVGVHKSTLSRCEEYQMAAGLARGQRRDVRRGHAITDPDSGLRDVDGIDRSSNPAQMDWDS